MRPEPTQVLAKILAPFAGFRGVVGLFLILAYVRRVVEPPLFVVADEAPIALAGRTRGGETFRLIAHDLEPGRRLTDSITAPERPFAIALVAGQAGVRGAGGWRDPPWRATQK